MRLAIALGAGAGAGLLIFLAILSASILIPSGIRVVPLHGMTNFVGYLSCVTAASTFIFYRHRTRLHWTH